MPISPKFTFTSERRGVLNPHIQTCPCGLDQTRGQVAEERIPTLLSTPKGREPNVPPLVRVNVSQAVSITVIAGGRKHQNRFVERAPRALQHHRLWLTGIVAKARVLLSTLKLVCAIHQKFEL
jgi:hypothetical protein